MNKHILYKRLQRIQNLISSIERDFPEEIGILLFAVMSNHKGEVTRTLEMSNMVSEELEFVQKFINSFKHLQQEFEKYKHYIHHKDGFKVICLDNKGFENVLEIGCPYKVVKTTRAYDRLCFELESVENPKGFDGYSSTRFKLFHYETQN